MFYGWRIVATTLVTHFVSFGFLFYSYGVFFKTFAAELGGSRLGVSLGLTLTQVITAVLAPLLGRLLDQGAIRRVMCLGATLMACGFFVGSQVVALWQFYLVLGLMLAAGAAMLGGLPGSTLVANWFVRRRGLALGISSVGISLSGAVMFPVATLLIGELGWRTTFLFYGMFALLFVVPTVLLVVVNRPEDMGLHPDGAARLPPSAKADAPEPLLPLAVGDQMIDHPGHLEWSARGVLRESNFWLIALVISLNFSSIGAVLTHIVPHATDLGFTPERAGFVGSVMPGLGIVGKVFFGWLADRNDPRAALWLACSFQALGLVLFLNASSYSALLLAGAVFGLGMGGLIPIWGVLLGASFGRHRFGRVMGLMSVFMLPIQMVGVPFAGYMFDLNGSYTVVFQTFVGFYVVAMLALFFLRVPEKAHRS